MFAKHHKRIKSIFRLFRRDSVSESSETPVGVGTSDADSGTLSASDSTITSNEHALMYIRIEPASPETQSQSLLKARDIAAQTFIIGRRRGLVAHSADDVDFSIRQVEPYTVSRRHCLIERFADSVTITDLSGKTGLLINGQRIGGRSENLKSIKLCRGTYNLILGPRDSTVRFRLIVGESN